VFIFLASRKKNFGILSQLIKVLLTCKGTSFAAIRAGIAFGVQFADVIFFFECFQHRLHGTFIGFEMDGKV